MPWKPKRPCRNRTCPELTVDGWCNRHRPAKEPQLARLSPSKRGYGRAHQRWRAHILALHPLCEDCLDEKPPRTTASTEAHHIDGDNTNLAEENGCGLCKPHHSRRTATSRRAFGNLPRQVTPGEG